MKNSFLVICFIVCCDTIYAQQKQLKVHTINICNLIYNKGVSQDFTRMFSLNDFIKIAPFSDLLKSNYEDFNQYNYGSHWTNSVCLSAGFQFANKQKTAYRNTPLLRLGINYHRSNDYSSFLDFETENTYEVLASFQYSVSVWFDSIYNKHASMEYSYDQLLLDGAFLLRTNPNKRFSFYTGLGLTAGSSVNTTIGISYGESKHTEVSFNDGSGYYPQRNYDDIYSNEADESFKLRNNKSIGAYIPIAIDYRLGLKKKYWKMIHLFFEARGGINNLCIKQLNPITGFRFDRSAGLKVEW